MNMNKLIFSMLCCCCWSLSYAQPNPSVVFKPKGALNISNAEQINTPNLDFAPAFYQDGIVYVTSEKKGPVDATTGEGFFELYFAKLGATNQPGKPQNFSVVINSQLHEGPVSFSKAGDKIYFTTNSGVNRKRLSDTATIHMKIYEATKGPTDWQNVQELPFNSNEYDCMHPALSVEGDRLYFVSNMPGGYGGMDIYMVEKRNGEWLQPVNMGPIINTPQDEAFPFMHDSGVMFFSSKGHGSMGGFDLFKIDLMKAKEKQVVRLEEPFNSTSDDIGFILNSESTMGFFTSDRPGGKGRDDIYLFEVPEGIEDVERFYTMNSIVEVYDARSNKPLPAATVRVFTRSAQGATEGFDLYDAELMPAEDGSGKLVMVPRRKDEEALNQPRRFTNGKGEMEVELRSEKEYIFLVNKSGYRTEEIRYSTKGKSKPERIPISLEPDNCMELRGIVIDANLNRIPYATIQVKNQCDGSVTTVMSNLKGEFLDCLSIGCKFEVSAGKQGYQSGQTHVSTENIRGSRSLSTELRITSIDPTTIPKPIPAGSIIVMENIYYDFDEYSIRSGAARELDELARVMNLYPSMEVELIAHTDSRGARDYNFQLSYKRAESAKQYLINKGISGNRIKTFGYGEAQVRNRCTDGVNCTEEEHEYNRRTEVKILRIDENVQFKQGFNTKGGF